MKTKNNIIKLLENGYHFSTISQLTGTQVKFLVEKIDKQKKETKEEMQVSKTDTATINALKSQKKPFNVYEKDMMEDETLNVVNDPDATEDGMGIFETEINEKFKSKAQQGLFWARCNKCKDENCKWCKMAKEFSDSTTKKDYKKDNFKKKFCI